MPCSPAEVPLCTEDVALYVARVQGRLPGRNKGDTAMLGKDPRAKCWGWEGYALGVVTRDGHNYGGHAQSSDSHILLCFRFTWGAWIHLSYTQYLPRALSPSLWGWD